jgi:hypothetical protein
MSHEIGRKTSEMFNVEVTERTECLGGENMFAGDSNNCHSCQKYKECETESLLRLGKIPGSVSVSDLMKRHHETRAKLGLLPAQYVSVEDFELRASELVVQSESTPKNAEHEHQLIAVSMNNPDVEHELHTADAAPSNDWPEDILLSNDEKFAAYIRRINESPVGSLPNNETVVLAHAEEESDLSETEDEALDLPEADAAAADVSVLQFLSTIKVNEDAIPPRFRKGGELAPFHASGTYSPDETQALQQRQMDDLIYLSKLVRPHTMHKKYEGIFTSDGKLNMELAGAFISEKAWSLEQKACKLLKLSEFQQMQCCTLASKKINDKWRNSIKHASEVEVDLNTIADKEEQFRKYVSEFTFLAQTIYLCRGLDTKNVPLVLSWLTGKEPISRQGIKAKIKRLENRLAWCSSGFKSSFDAFAASC